MFVCVTVMLKLQSSHCILSVVTRYDCFPDKVILFCRSNCMLGYTMARQVSLFTPRSHSGDVRVSSRLQFSCLYIAIF